jgi:hypothetical protein
MDLTERYQGEESCEKRLFGKEVPPQGFACPACKGTSCSEGVRACTHRVLHEILNTGFSLTADTMMENTHLPSGSGLWPSASWHTKAAEHERMCSSAR